MQTTMKEKQTHDVGAPEGGASGLPRRLGLFSAITVLVGSAIGSGIFRSPAGIATKVPDENMYLLVWVLGGIFTLAGALTYAELAGAFPQTGGVFVYLREAYGKLPAFLFGWSELLILRASALGAVSTVFAEYFLRSLGMGTEASAPYVPYVAAAAITVIAICNIVGVQFGALIQNLTTVGKCSALIILILATFLIGANYAAPAAQATATAAGGGMSVAMFGLAFISLLWVYDGWADVTFISGEVKRPEKFLPLALIIGTLTVMAIYLLTNLAYLNLLGIGQIANSKLVAADAAYRIVGGVGVTLVSIAVMVSAFGTLNGSMMTGPRIFYAMADEGLFFKKIGAVHPRFKTPYVAIALAAGMALLFVSMRSFEQLADAFVLAIWPFYALGVGSIYILRRRLPKQPRRYRTIGYPFTPALFLVAALFLLGNALVDDFRFYLTPAAERAAGASSSGALLVMGIILLGVPVYYIWQAYRKSRQ